ncbi:MAG: hypothetical protein AAGF23_20320 [Acidobacteriota bacterium]
MPMVLLIGVATMTTARDLKGFTAEPHWRLTADAFDVCNTSETGRVCAEWGDGQINYGLTCCVDPSAIGTSDPSACDLLVNGHLSYLPDRQID